MFKKNMICCAIALSIVPLCAIAENPAPASCPEFNKVVPTKSEKDRDGVTSMVYCAPSVKSCQWKGFDPMAEKANKINGLTKTQMDGKPTNNNGLTYCDYDMDDGNSIRMTFQK